MFIANKNKTFRGGINTELEAARIYDEMAIRANGTKAKTNFNYTKAELEVIVNKYLDI